MSGAARKILVVDDTDASRYLVARILRSNGYEVCEAATGGQALELAGREQPEVVVLDVKLPDMHGFDVAERLKTDARTRSMAILHLSASFTAAESRAEGLQRGADAYLTHPVDAPVLCATVAALVRLRDAEQRERQARERAEANEARQQFVAQLLPQMLWSNDAAGAVDYVNQRWLEATGLTAEEARGSGWTASIHPEDRERVLAAWKRALESGEPFDVECRQGNRRSGEYRWKLVRALPMRGDDGAIARWYGTSTDIDDQKHAEAERERLLHQLQRSAEERERLIERLRDEDRRKTEFLAILSHELRNPLAPIRNSVHILERAAPGGEQARRARQIIDRQAEQLTRLIDDLLDVTRISRGKIRLQSEQVDLGALVRGVGEDLREVFASRGVALSIRVEAEALYVQGDQTRLAQVVGNLLQNSAKFTPRGGHAELSLCRSGNEAVLRVRDSGAGIQPDVLPRLFEPFVQADRTLDRSNGGLGLGLALVKALVELHHGEVVATSAGPGSGAEFTIRLPLASRPAADAAADDAAGQRRVPRRRVLVIEDNEDAARTLKEVLELGEHEVEIAFDGAEGLARAREFRPDVVLCDIGLPGMDGYQVARAMRADPAFGLTTLIALSGYALQEDVDRSAASGFDHHMPKPPDLAALGRLLDEGR